MKVKYFARGSILNIQLAQSKIPSRKTTKVKTTNLKDVTKLPKSMRFSHIAYPGSLAELTARVIAGELSGKMMEFTSDGKLLGVGVIARETTKTALFVVDVTKHGLERADVILSRTAGAASKWKTKIVRSVIPKDHFPVYNSLTRWKSETSTDIPVTRLI
jgi:hypothetical protein